MVQLCAKRSHFGRVVFLHHFASDFLPSPAWSIKETEFGCEINFHLPGPPSLSEPGIFVFPKITACLACGAARFVPKP
jgi:hypothetical protein